MRIKRLARGKARHKPYLLGRKTRIAVQPQQSFGFGKAQVGNERAKISASLPFEHRRKRARPNAEHGRHIANAKRWARQHLLPQHALYHFQSQGRTGR